MNRNVVFGAGLAIALVGAALVLTGGAKPSPVPSQVQDQGAPSPSLEPMMEADVKTTSNEAKPVTHQAPQAPSHP